MGNRRCKSWVRYRRYLGCTCSGLMYDVERTGPDIDPMYEVHYDCCRVTFITLARPPGNGHTVWTLESVIV